MWKLLLAFAIFQFVHASCPAGYDLVKDGECRGLQAKMTLYFNQAATKAIEKCEEVNGKPVIIHNEEHQSYWKTKAPSTFEGFLILGIVCNTKTKKYEWSDGSAIDFKPQTGQYNEELNKPCNADYSWDIHPDGYWSYGGPGNPIQGSIYCTTQLQTTPIDEDCGDFTFDSEDKICYQVGTAGENWQDAQKTCKQYGANLASIHNKQENAFLRRLAISKGAVNGVFIGASARDDASPFIWVDGTNTDYENYAPGFPKKNFGYCIAMDTSSAAGTWMNVDCNAKMPIACVRKQGVAFQPTCTGEDLIEGSMITSPGYPLSASTPCDYFLTVPAGRKVQVEILSLEANSCCDSLVLYDGPMGGAVIAKLTGSMTNATYATKSSNIMRVSWQPNGGVNVRGFTMSYRSL